MSFLEDRIVLGLVVGLKMSVYDVSPELVSKTLPSQLCAVK